MTTTPANGYGTVSRAVTRAIGAQETAEPEIVNFVAFGYETPGQLVVYLAYVDRETLAAAERSGHTELMKKRVADALAEEGYPPWSGRVEFVSEQEVNEQGGPQYYFR